MIFKEFKISNGVGSVYININSIVGFSAMNYQTKTAIQITDGKEYWVDGKLEDVVKSLKEILNIDILEV